MILVAGKAASTGGAPGPSLRDIHLPAEPSWWPPAPGWWLLAVLVLVVAVVAIRAWRRHRREQARQRRILHELDRLAARQHENGGQAELLRGLHQLLRRVARQHDVHATLQRGEAWRDTLARVPVDAATLDRLFSIDQLLYQPAGEHDDEAIIDAVRKWLRLAVKPSRWKSVTPVRETVDV